MLAGSMAIAVGIVGGLIYLASLPSRPEPVYQGKTLSRWLKQLDDGRAFGIGSGALPPRTPAQLQAARAIQAMGTQAFALLMEDLHATPDPHSFRMRCRESLNRLSRRFIGEWLFSPITEEDRIRWRAAQGLAALGPLAKPAVPELNRLLHTNYYHSSIKEAAYVLATVGPEGTALLTNAVATGGEWSAMCAIWALGQHPVAGTNVIPFLLDAAASSSEGIACGAIQVLGMLHTDGERVIPALTNALTSSRSAVRRDAAWALGQFGAQAAPAARTLQSLTNTPEVTGAALDALRKIQVKTSR